MLHTASLAGSGDTVVEGSLVFEVHDGSAAVLEAGAEGGAGSLYIAAGAELDASAVSSAAVYGVVTNCGSALYDDMEIAATGSSAVSSSGTETGGTLTVSGSHIVGDGGSSTWDSYEVAGGGYSETGGDLTVNETLSVEDGGTMYIGDTGVLDASAVSATAVSGSLENSGSASYSDMAIAGTGESTVSSSGTETGENLTVSGTHVVEDGGTSSWNGYEVAGGGYSETGGELTVSETLSVDDGGTMYVAGTGVLDAAGVAETAVSGSLENSGSASYIDMTVAGTGESTVSGGGSETGEDLVIEGSHNVAEGGTSSWNSYTVASGGLSETGGELTVSETLSVGTGGTMYIGSTGVLDAAGVTETVVSGSLENSGSASYTDMTVAGTGESTVSGGGSETGEDLVIEGSHYVAEGGTSSWNSYTVASGGNSETGGELTVSETLSVDDGGTMYISSTGVLDAAGVPGTLVSGSLENNGEAHYDDMAIAGTGSSTVGSGGCEDGSDLAVSGSHSVEEGGESRWEGITIEEGGSETNAGTVTAGTITINGGSFENTGTVETDSLVLNDGTLAWGAGSINAGETVLSGGDLVIGNDLEPADENRVAASLDLDGAGTNVWVIGNGELLVGEGSATLAEEAGELGLDLSPGSSPALLVVSQAVSQGSGSVAVGSSVYDTGTGTGSDSVEAGGLLFGSGSVTLVSESLLSSGTAVFTSGVTGSTVTVEEGASLVFSGIPATGRYVITEGYSTGDGSLISGWSGSDTLYSLTKDASGLSWILTAGYDSYTVWVDAELENVSNAYPGIAIPTAATDSMNESASPDAGDTFIQDVLRSGLDSGLKTRIINSVSQAAQAAGATASAFNDLDAASGAVDSHISFLGPAFSGSGRLRTDGGPALWIDLTGGRSRTRGLAASGGMKGGTDSRRTGFVMGADIVDTSSGWLFGAAFGYSRGSSDSSGSWLGTAADTESFSSHLYGLWTPNERFNVSGQLAFQWSDADIVQQVGYLGYGRAEASPATRSASASVRAEYRREIAGGAAVVPHIGVRYVRTNGGSFDTRLDGEKVLRSSPKAAGTLQVPAGIGVRGDCTSPGGWHFRAGADLGWTAQFGDRKSVTAVSNLGGATDATSAAFTGHGAATFGLGLEASRGQASFGASYGMTDGSGKSSHALRAGLRWRFQ